VTVHVDCCLSFQFSPPVKHGSHNIAANDDQHKHTNPTLLPLVSEHKKGKTNVNQFLKNTNTWPKNHRRSKDKQQST
jgi:hypothetical protein